MMIQLHKERNEFVLKGVNISVRVFDIGHKRNNSP
jgi:hypothetical protein